MKQYSSTLVDANANANALQAICHTRHRPAHVKLTEKPTLIVLCRERLRNVDQICGEVGFELPIVRVACFTQCGRHQAARNGRFLLVSFLFYIRVMTVQGYVTKGQYVSQSYRQDVPRMCHSLMRHDDGTKKFVRISSEGTGMV